MTPENFGLLFKSLVIAISGIIALGLAVLTLSGKVRVLIFHCHCQKPYFRQRSNFGHGYNNVFFCGGSYCSWTSELLFIKANSILVGSGSEFRLFWESVS
jgi:hypothetical protein